jgi:hypothetical protein
VSDGIGFDFSELDKLAADLGEVPGNAGPNIRSAVQFTATLVKRESAKSVGRGRWSAAAAAIDYDIHGTTGARLGGISAEVGYNKGKAGGPLGNIREFGAPAQNTGPSNDLLNALENNQADFQKGLEKALKDAERKAGL